MFDPPNSLKMKAKDKMAADVIAKQLDEDLKVARDRLIGEKLRRDSFQICILWRLMQEQQPGMPQFEVDMRKLGNLTRSIERRLPAASMIRRLELCVAILAAAEGLQLAVDRNASMHLLGHGALSLHQYLCPEKSPADQLNEIDATVAIIRARSQTTAALAS